MQAFGLQQARCHAVPLMAQILPIATCNAAGSELTNESHMASRW